MSIINDIQNDDPFSQLSLITPQQCEDLELMSQETHDSFFDKEEIIEEGLASINDQIDQQGKRSKRGKQMQPEVPMREQHLIDQFQEEEALRYQNPAKPFYYKDVTGQPVIVAPACKKNADLKCMKVREHYLLKTDWPAFVNLLNLMRDAVSKLENGQGTRAQICALLKESQYIHKDIDPIKLTNIVSGALDWLHYENDPCVVYNSQQKLWFYKHREKTEKDFENY